MGMQHWKFLKPWTEIMETSKNWKHWQDKKDKQTLAQWNVTQKNLTRIKRQVTGKGKLTNKKIFDKPGFANVNREKMNIKHWLKIEK